MPNSLNTAGLYLINTIFDLYIFIWIVRLILAWAHADFFNPFSQFILKLTQPLAMPLRKMLPKVANIELSSVVIILLLEMVKFFLDGLLTIGMPNPAGLVILAFADSLKALLNVFFYGIILQAILSLVQTNYSPFTYILTQITSPILRPFRRLIPPVSGIDLSPVPALIILQLLIIVVVDPLLASGSVLAFS